MDTSAVQGTHAHSPVGVMGTSLGILGGAALIGFFIPAYYDWSGADQSRPSPWIPAAIGTLFAFSLLVSLGLLWGHSKGLVWLSASEQRLRLKRPWDGFTMACVALVIAVALAALKLASFAVIWSFIALLCVLAWCVYHAWLYPRLRWPMLALVFGCGLSFLWILVGKYSQDGNPGVLLFLPGAPMLLPAGYTGMLLGVNLHEVVWLANIYMALVYALGVGLMHIGQKRAIAFTLFMIVISIASSFGFHAMIRA